MSLKIAAEHLKSHGRGQDSELVHMTPGEIKGLQQLAEAHGGSLTINPNTGLPEAGFLSNILPTVIGAGVGIATGNPFLGAAIGGGLGYMQSGTLMGGLMAGLGAWSGSGLLNDLAGVAGAGEAIAPEAIGAAETATAQGVGNAAKTGLQALDTSLADAGSVLSGNAGIANQAMAGAGSTVGGAGMVQGANGVFYDPEYLVQNPALAKTVAASPVAKVPNFAESVKDLSPMDRLTTTASRAGSGFGELISDPTGKGLAFIKEHPWGLVSAAGSLLNAVPQPKVPQPGERPLSEYEKRLARYKISPDFRASIPTPPANPYQAQYANYVVNPYNPYAAEGGVVKMAAGGISTVAPANVDFMGGDMYPQSQQDRSYYATPSQMPTSAQQALASYEPKTNPLTGQPTANMASGGSTDDATAAYLAQMPSRTPAPIPVQQAAPVTPKVDTSHFTPYQDYLLSMGADAARIADLSGREARGYYPQGLGVGMYGMGAMAYNEPRAFGYSTMGGIMSPMAKMIKDKQAVATLADNFQPYVPDSAIVGNHIYVPQYAKGGAAHSPTEVESLTNFALHKDTDPNTRDLDAWSAAKYRTAKLNKRFGNQAVKDQALNVRGLGDVAPTELAHGGDVHYNLGGYSDGGRLLKGPGDGMSDNIPAIIGSRQPARLADGEFVVPADVVSHLGNGSTDAGAKHLYKMMDNVRKARTGNKKQGKQIKPEKFLPKA